ncbi:NADH:flavin oxidoreductase, putative, partial [Bodo saltans]
FQEMGAEDNVETFDAAIKLAASFQIGGIEVMDGLGFGFHKKTEPYTLAQARVAIAAGNPAGTTALAGNVGYTLETAEKAVAEGRADIITFGRPYMSNPDLPERFRESVPLAADPQYPDWWGTDTAEGYITFPRATAKATAPSLLGTPLGRRRSRATWATRWRLRRRRSLRAARTSSRLAARTCRTPTCRSASARVCRWLLTRSTPTGGAPTLLRATLRSPAQLPRRQLSGSSEACNFRFFINKLLYANEDSESQFYLPEREKNDKG